MYGISVEDNAEMDAFSAFWQVSREEFAAVEQSCIESAQWVRSPDPEDRDSGLLCIHFSEDELSSRVYVLAAGVTGDIADDVERKLGRGPDSLCC
ncbi:hypothetical protein MUG78_16730 [Gordonia alkaliphila]|uniref:hypothetical protein n=1 Tax=Gordonia alkaliphila TaxID=1053547 RepID=UPI001FF44365|nr:hypothetical protein [Gordonia alkaliphila]MCK0441047.1 hypothetical protein [Gordonia alkaliphila]